MNRRSFIGRSMLVALGAHALGSAGRAYAQDRTLTVAWSGGTVADAEKKIFVPAFERETGWRVRMVASEATLLPQLESMVKVGQTQWDVAELSGGKLPIAADGGMLEKLDYSKIDPSSKLPAVARQPYGVAWGSYSTVLVQNTKRTPPGKKMRSWADFWDVRTFPGPRSLRDMPQGNLEFALLADGADGRELYSLLGTPAGVERAFKKLSEIKPHVSSWWKNGAQSVQLISNGDAYYTSMFNGRINKLIEDGIPVEIVWNGGTLILAYMGIPKGSKNIPTAHQYIRIRTMVPELGREFLNVMPYPSFAPGLLDGLPSAQVASLPSAPANASVQFVMDDAFWAKNIKVVQERWNEWMLK